ncbi:hypothetical protein ACROAK_06890 [Shewanella oncorhynchi]|uniref:hypothetical protein n=1 Tax=Shewanella oncorhynchi TaxID=2726434 RepID=UPI003D7A1F91
MEIMTFLPTVLSLLGVLVATYAMIKSSKSLKERLRIERNLAHKLGQELKRRNIDSKISIEHNKIIVRSDAEGVDADHLKRQIDDALRSALLRLIASEREIVKKTLEQPSKQGQMHYRKKLINNSLHKLEEQKVNARC